MSFGDIILRLNDILIADVTISNRTLKVPDGYPKGISVSDVPMIINRITGLSGFADNRYESRDYDVTITSTLYIYPVGTGIDVLNAYDVIGYVDQFTDTIAQKSRFQLNNIALSGVRSDVYIQSIGEIPEIVSYPEGSDSQYWGCVITLIVPYRKTKDC